MEKTETIFIGIRVTPEAKKKIERMAKENRRSMSKEIERIIMEAK